MIVANQKKNENIAEYILYLWQLEDLIRAWDFKMQPIKENIIAQYHQTEQVNEQIEIWYTNLMNMLENEGKKKQGHSSLSLEALGKLEKLHDQLMENPKESKYQEVYLWAKNPIRDFRLKTKLKGEHEISICFTALYSLMASRMKKESLNQETQDAFKNISNLIALLSAIYHRP